MIPETASKRQRNACCDIGFWKLVLIDRGVCLHRRQRGVLVMQGQPCGSRIDPGLEHLLAMANSPSIKLALQSRSLILDGSLTEGLQSSQLTTARLRIF